MQLVLRCYQVTDSFPVSERYALAREIRRAAVSIPSNVAEGHCRRSTPAYANHVSIALGSQGELDTCLEIAHHLKYLSTEHWQGLVEQVNEEGRLLNGLFTALKAKIERERH